MVVVSVKSIANGSGARREPGLVCSRQPSIIGTLLTYCICASKTAKGALVCFGSDKYDLLIKVVKVRPSNCKIPKIKELSLQKTEAESDVMSFSGRIAQNTLQMKLSPYHRLDCKLDGGVHGLADLVHRQLEGEHVRVGTA